MDKSNGTDKEESPFNSAGREEPEGERRHPFVDGILSAKLPTRWKGLGIDRYDGSTDPNGHIDVYEIQMHLYTTNQAIMCRVFPTSLKGMTLNWFTRLLPYSLDCFRTLVNLFSIQFATSKPHRLTSLALVNIRQDKGETLRVFMERFDKLALQIRNLNPKVTSHHMVTALGLRPFRG